MTMATVVYALSDDVSTDVIYPGRYMATVLPTETPQFAFADDSGFSGKLKAQEIPPGSVLVAGKNFGCGSSREQAVSCLKGHELVIVARGFARIFLQNAINLGLRVVACPTLEAVVGDELDVGDAQIINRRSGKRYSVLPLPSSRRAIMDAGGLIPYTRQRLAATGRKRR
jgi:3-isopropylmalate/(R)-2-methylmalate dehydratase small subunit